MSNEPAEVLARMAAAYGGCKTYRDNGVVTTAIFSPSRLVERKPFSTRFVREEGFLFEFRSRRGEDDWDQYAVWNEGERTRTWWSMMPEREESDSLSMALAAATGISGGSAFRVPGLLMAELYNRYGPSISSQDARFLDVPEAASENCAVIEIALAPGSIEQLWINRSTFLLHRVVEPRCSLGPLPIDARKLIEAGSAGRDSVEYETTTVYEAAFDAPIWAEELVFARAK